MRITCIDQFGTFHLNLSNFLFEFRTFHFNLWNTSIMEPFEIQCSKYNNSLNTITPTLYIYEKNQKNINFKII